MNVRPSEDILIQLNPFLQFFLSSPDDLPVLNLPVLNFFRTPSPAPAQPKFTISHNTEVGKFDSHQSSVLTTAIRDRSVTAWTIVLRSSLKQTASIVIRRMFSPPLISSSAT